MLSANREERRAYIRDSANRLASVSSVTLSRDTAHSLCQRLHEVTAASTKIGADFYLELLGRCMDLCRAAERFVLSEKQAQQANEALKEAIVMIQTSLFSMALFNDVEKDRPKLVDSTAQIQQLLLNFEAGRQGGRPAPGTPTPDPGGEPDPQTFGQQAAEENPAESPRALGDREPEPASAEPPVAITSSESPPAEPERSPLAPPQPGNGQALLHAVDRLVRSSGFANPSAGELLAVVRAARQSHTVPFSGICRRLSAESGFQLETPTPECPIETSLAPALAARLREWLTHQCLQQTQPSVSAREVGRTLWLELCLGGPFVLHPAHFAGMASAGVSGIYLAADGRLVHRASFDLSLAVFEAFEVESGGRTYLIPSSDIQAGDDREPPATTVRATGFPTPGSPPRPGARALPGLPRRSLCVRWREHIVRVEADSVSGPAHYSAAKALLPEREAQGIVGMARTAAGEPAWVVDTCAWLDRLSLGRDTVQGQPALTLGAPVDRAHRIRMEWQVFHCGGRIFAIPAGEVLATGQVEGELLRGGYLETPRGVCALRDFAGLAGLCGEPRDFRAGTPYLVLRAGNGLVALAAERLEPSFSLLPWPAAPVPAEPWLIGKAIHPVSQLEVSMVDPESLLEALHAGQAVSPAA